MKNFTFAATSSFRLFEPMEDVRKSGKSKDYRTLTDSLSEDDLINTKKDGPDQRTAPS